MQKEKPLVHHNECSKIVLNPFFEGMPDSIKFYIDSNWRQGIIF